MAATPFAKIALFVSVCLVACMCVCVYVVPDFVVSSLRCLSPLFHCACSFPHSLTLSISLLLSLSPALVGWLACLPACLLALSHSLLRSSSPSPVVAIVCPSHPIHKLVCSSSFTIPTTSHSLRPRRRDQRSATWEYRIIQHDRHSPVTNNCHLCPISTTNPTSPLTTTTSSPATNAARRRERAHRQHLTLSLSLLHTVLHCLSVSVVLIRTASWRIDRHTESRFHSQSSPTSKPDRLQTHNQCVGI